MAVKCILTGQTPSVLDGVTKNVQTQLNDKVDKVTGKGLSTNDYTSAEKTKLSGIETGAQKNTITGVKGSAETTYRTGNVNITATNIGLGNVNNTSDAEKPISTATKTALDGKQAIVTGAATTITDNNLTANRALISNSSGKVAVSSVTSTELGYLDGVTSNIQTQLNNKLSSAPVTSVNNKTGAVSLVAGDVGAQPSISANGILKGDGSGNITAASETEVELVSLPNICNSNLLDNWYFGNPINQRGQTSYTANWAYSIDRWLCAGDGNLVVGDGYCTFTGAVDQGLNCNISETFGQTLTATILLADGTLYTGTAVDSDSAADIPFVSSPNGTGLYLSLNATDLSGHRRFRTYCSPARNVKAIKLELGSQQTLAHPENGVWVLNEIPKFGDQLAECQRYAFSPLFEAYATAIICNLFVSSAANGVAWGEVTLPVSMRYKPVFSGNASKFWIVAENGGGASHPTAITVIGLSADKVMIKVEGSYTANTQYILYVEDPFTSADFLLSADL